MCGGRRGRRSIRRRSRPRQALSWVVAQQIAAGIDVGNNGEQQREGFFLYVQRRMSGFGGAW
jgi:5-methyltetrahydropteroyltriglutamate--homocysteine methyltransferase